MEREKRSRIVEVKALDAKSLLSGYDVRLRRELSAS